MAKPVYTTPQIITQLTTSWGGGDTHTYSWYDGTNTRASVGDTITFSIDLVPTNASGTATEIAGKQPMTPIEISAAILSFRLWDDLIAPSLVQVNNGGANITFDKSSSTDGGGTYAASWYSGATGSDRHLFAEQVWVNSSWFDDSDFSNSNYGLITYLHEIGHTLGLSHPGTYDASAGPTAFETDAVFAQDNRQYTIMSYFGGYKPGVGWQIDGTIDGWYYPQTPMVYDIVAIQAKYGADFTTRTGNTTYGFHSSFASSDAEYAIYDFSVNAHPIFTIWDGAGIDTLDGSGYSGAQIIDLTPGHYSSMGGLTNNIGIAFNCIVENACGGSGNDTIIGNSYNNMFTGGGGTDSINGGGGRDVASFNFAFSAASIVHNPNGSWTISGPGQIVTLTSIEIAQFTDRMLSIREQTRGDFNGDGMSDILWRNDNGGLISWNINDNQILVSNSFGKITMDWHVAGSGDFNGDGRSDILWRNDNGGLISWNMNDGEIIGTNFLGQISADWNIVGIGDFNGDGKSDILWRNDDGGLISWNMNDGQILDFNSFGKVTTDWHVVGTGDFNGDGKSDILWRNNDGALISWNMNGAQILNQSSFGKVSTDWHVAGTGDFNGDGKTDILWQNDNGNLISWNLNNNQIIGSHFLGGASGDWHIQAIKDLNGDGMSDILWRHDGGSLISWDMNDGQIIDRTVLAGVSTDWHVVA